MSSINKSGVNENLNNRQVLTASKKSNDGIKSLIAGSLINKID